MVSTEPSGRTVEFLVGQAEVLEAIATDRPLEETLDRLARLVQYHLPGVRCSLLRLETNGKRLRFGSAPDLPPTFGYQIDGLPIGPRVASCGTAAHTGCPYIATDTESDAHWDEWREFAQEHELRAVWSVPILNAGGRVLGTLAISHRQPTAQPSEGEMNLALLAARLAALAIERSQQARALAQSEEKWRGMFEHSLDAILIIDDQRSFVDANSAACEMIGADLKDILGHDINVFIRPLTHPDLPDTVTRWAKFLRDGKDAKECTVHRPDGGIRYVSFRARANFQPGLHVCVARDITEQRLAEDSLRRTEQLYRSLVETTGTGYLVADEHGRVLDANAEYVHLTGHANLTDILGRYPSEWIAAHDRERYAIGIARCLERGVLRDLEIDFLHPRGHVLPVEINTTAVPTGEGNRLLTLCHDITGRLQTRRELQNASRELETRVERRTAELARASEQIRSRARQQEAVAELGRRALAGMAIDALMQRAVDSVVDILGVEYGAVLEHADPQSDQLILQANSGWMATELGKPLASTDPTGLAGYALQRSEPVIYEDLAQEARFRVPARLLAQSVKSGITVQIPGDPRPFGLISGQTRLQRAFTLDDAFFLQALGNVLGAAIDRHRAEDTVRRAQQSAVQANNAKLDFLSRMSHELRTPLNAILGFSQLLELERLDGGQRESVEQITRAGRHLLELVNEVLDISRIDSGHIALAPEALAMDELLREALDLIRPLADARDIELIPGPGCTQPGVFVLADRQRLRQVLLNLLSNAVKYNRDAGSVTLDGGPSPDGQHLRISVSDTGVGITPANLARLYTPFERLGAENTNVEGSGMGLALSKRLVETQKGELSVESEPGVGTTFRVDLPTAAAPITDEIPILDDLLISRFFDDDPPAPLKTAPHQPPMPTTPLAPKAQHTVLHIEDNEAKPAARGDARRPAGQRAVAHRLARPGGCDAGQGKSPQPDPPRFAPARYHRRGGVTGTARRRGDAGHARGHGQRGRHGDPAQPGVQQRSQRFSHQTVQRRAISQDARSVSQVDAGGEVERFCRRGRRSGLSPRPFVAATTKMKGSTSRNAQAKSNARCRRA